MKGIRRLLILTLSLFMMFSSCLVISAGTGLILSAAQINGDGDLVITATGDYANVFVSKTSNGEAQISFSSGCYNGSVRGNSTNMTSDTSKNTITIYKSSLIDGGFVDGTYVIRYSDYQGDEVTTNVTLNLGKTVTPNKASELSLNGDIKAPIVGTSSKFDKNTIKIVDQNNNEVEFTANWAKKIENGLCKEWSDDGNTCKLYVPRYSYIDGEIFNADTTYYLYISYCYVKGTNDKNISTTLNVNNKTYKSVDSFSGVTGDCFLITHDYETFVIPFTPTTSAKTVAKIGNTGYASLQDAINKATDGSTIEIQDDLTVDTLTVSGNKTLTLNMNGKTITQNYSKYTSNDSGDATRYHSLISVDNGANLTITGNGTFVGPKGEDGAKFDSAPLVRVEGEKTSITIVNGTFTAGGKDDCGMYGLYSLNGGTIILGDKNTKTGPTINTHFAAIGQNNTTSPSYVTIYGGTYTADVAPTEKNEWWSYFCAPIYASATGDINIYGGTFNGYYGISSRYANVTQNINIYGGTFNTTNISLFVDNKNGVAGQGESRKISISGGVFSSDVTTYLADGYDIAKVGDKYAVAKKNGTLPEVKVTQITPTIAEKTAKETLKAGAKASNEPVTVNDDSTIKLESDLSIKLENKTEDTIKKEVINASKDIDASSVNLIPLDVTLKVINGSDEKTITELTNKITVTLYLDETNLSKIANKDVKIVRIHGNETTVLPNEDVKLNGNILTFKTNKFSTYVIAYSNISSSGSSTKYYDPKDKNQDGIITCDEEMNSANWVWSTTKNACVYKVSNTSAR